MRRQATELISKLLRGIREKMDGGALDIAAGTTFRPTRGTARHEILVVAQQDQSPCVTLALQVREFDCALSRGFTKPANPCDERWHVESEGEQDIRVLDDNRLVVATLPHAWKTERRPAPEMATAKRRVEASSSLEHDDLAIQRMS